MNTPQLQAQTLQEISTSLGLCFGLVDNNDYVFLVLATEEYPRSTLRGILNELKSEFYKNNPRATNDLVEGHTVDAKFIQELSEKYSKVVSKTSEAQRKLQEVHLRMQDNIKHVIGNQEEVKDLDYKAKEVLDKAGKVELGAAELESMMKWRNVKLWVILGMAIFALVLYVIFGILKGS